MKSPVLFCFIVLIFYGCSASVNQELKRPSIYEEHKNMSCEELDERKKSSAKAIEDLNDRRSVGKDFLNGSGPDVANPIVFLVGGTVGVIGGSFSEKNQRLSEWIDYEKIKIEEINKIMENKNCTY